jgi:hypothetical protein
MYNPTGHCCPSGLAHSACRPLQVGLSQPLCVVARQPPRLPAAARQPSRRRYSRRAPSASQVPSCRHASSRDVAIAGSRDMPQRQQLPAIDALRSPSSSPSPASTSPSSISVSHSLPPPHRVVVLHSRSDSPSSLALPS